MYTNKTGIITFAAILAMITLSNCFLNGMLTDDCVENSSIEAHNNHDDFFPRH